MRFILAASLLALATASLAQSPPGVVAQPSKLDATWQAKTRAFYEKSIEIPTVAGRGQMPLQADLIADELRAAGFAEQDIKIVPYEGEPGDKTVALIARWRADRPTGKPILLMAHMDMVEAKRADWKFDPFEFREEGGYFYGRGSYDNKAGMTGLVMSFLKLKQAGWKPNRDLILFFTGDEETGGKGARLGATEWRQMTDAEYALNSDGGGGAFLANGAPLGFALQTAEKTFQTFHFTVRNKGGHSSRPRKDNAIYELATALKKLEAHRFQPMLNETTRGYFALRARQEGDSALGKAIRAWLANEKDDAAADAIEGSELEVGLTRTRCVATELQAGHADNALPQMARATVNCRIMPGVSPDAIQAELKGIAGAGVEVTKDPNYVGRSTPVTPQRADVAKAYQDAVTALNGKGVPVAPYMSAGATDGAFFREAGMPVYGMDGSWVISPEDERAHGLDERMPVRAVYDNVLFWEMVLKQLAGR
ncbi:MAG: M20/M25/M40 family metallo-hydrolase [Pseudomonadota bacterium]|nr:M20/M25/M40 family metallo-hydrolase [Pseudomonadota bacterium]